MRPLPGQKGAGFKPDVFDAAHLDDMTKIAHRALISSVRVAELSGRRQVAHLIRTALVAVDDVREAL